MNATTHPRPITAAIAEMRQISDQLYTLAAWLDRSDARTGRPDPSVRAMMPSVPAETREADAKWCDADVEFWKIDDALSEHYRRLAHLSRHAAKVQEIRGRMRTLAYRIPDLIDVAGELIPAIDALLAEPGACASL